MHVLATDETMQCTCKLVTIQGKFSDQCERISRPNNNCRSILGVNMKQETTRQWMWYWKRWLNYSSLWITFKINLFLNLAKLPKHKWVFYLKTSLSEYRVLK